ncbi:MFS transporter [Methanosarcinales archaeon ex4572_44]|nr:MAG: MFS transporter [Methanosarcinales archaeon ex4572_44]
MSLYTLVFAIMALSNAAIPILPELSRGESIAASLIFSAYFTGALIAMLPSGILADRYGNTRLIHTAAVLTLTAGIILTLSNNLWLILLARFTEGLGAAAFFPAAFAILAEFEKKEQYIGELNFLLNLGLGAGVFVAGIFAETNMNAETNMKNGIVIFTTLSIIPLLLIWKLSKETKKEIVRSDQSTVGLKQILAKLRSTRIYRTLRKHQLNPKSQTRTKRYTSLHTKKTMSILIRPGLLSVWITAFILFGATGAIISIYPDYAAEKIGKDELGIYLSTVYIGAMITSIIGGHLKIQHDTVVRTGVLAAGIGALTTIVHPIGFALIGAGAGLGLIGLVSGIANLATERGITMGIFNTCTYTGLAALPILSGIAISITREEVIIIANSLLLLATAVLPLKILKRRYE